MMEDTVSYKDIAALSPKEKEQFFRYVNQKITKIGCKCTQAMKIRDSPNLCIDCRIEYYDGVAAEAKRKVEELKKKKEKENER